MTVRYGMAQPPFWVKTLRTTCLNMVAYMFVFTLVVSSALKITNIQNYLKLLTPTLIRDHSMTLIKANQTTIQMMKMT